MPSSSITKTSMWQTGDGVAICDVADDADVSFHMLSHKVKGTKIKKQNSQKDQTQKCIENFTFLFHFLFFMIYGMSSSSSYTAHTWFSPKESWFFWWDPSVGYIWDSLVRIRCGMYMMMRMATHRSWRIENKGRSWSFL